MSHTKRVQWVELGVMEGDQKAAVEKMEGISVS